MQNYESNEVDGVCVPADSLLTADFLANGDYLFVSAVGRSTESQEPTHHLNT